MYRVIVRFTDNEDGHVYNIGDEYPRKGFQPSESRVRKLSTTANKRGIALIEEVVVAQKTKADHAMEAIDSEAKVDKKPVDKTSAPKRKRKTSTKK